MTLYANTLISHSYRFKRLMLAHSDTKIEQTLRNARLLFEKLAKVLDSPTEATENYRISIEQLVTAYKMQEDLTAFERNIEHQYAELQKLLKNRAIDSR